MSVPGYWDVIGDGWNPGHTMTPEEIEHEERSLTCFRTGWYDRERGIYWKYTDRSQVGYEPHKDRKAVGESLVGLATLSVEDMHIYEVENG